MIICGSSLVSLNAFLHFIAEAPGLNSQFEGKPGRSFDVDFEERLENIRRCMPLSSPPRLYQHQCPSTSMYLPFWWTRSALEKKKTQVVNEFGPIDYDAPAPVQTDQKTIGLGAKVHTTYIFQTASGLIYKNPVAMTGWSWHCCCCLWFSFCSWRLSSHRKVCYLLEALCSNN